MWYAFDTNGELVYAEPSRKKILDKGYSIDQKVAAGVFDAVIDIPVLNQASSIRLYDNADTARFYGMKFEERQENKRTVCNSDITFTMSVKTYLRSIVKMLGDTSENVFLNKTIGGQIWVSNIAPATCNEVYEKDKNYIEFDDSDFFMRLPKEIWEHVLLEPGKSKDLKTILKELI